MKTLVIASLLLAAVRGSAQTTTRIEGVVGDSVHGRPLAGATVIATPTPAALDTVFRSALTDDRGRFTLGAVVGVHYTLTVEHPWIDSTEVGAPPVDVVPSVTGVRASLSIPSPATLRRVFCPAAVRDTSLGVALGVVHGPEGRAAPGASVVFTWSDFDVDRATATVRPKQISARVTADSNGVYRACGIPVARSIFVQAQAESAQSGVLEERIGESGLLVRDFTLGVARLAGAGDSSAAAGRFTVTGRVTSTAGAPVASAQVQLFGTTLAARTDASGEFRLAGLPAGTQGLEVVALGYYPRRLRVEVAAGTAPVLVRLERAAVVLDSMRVIARRVAHPGSASYREFDERAAHGQGQYITEDEIARRRPFDTAELLRTTPGIKVVGSGTGARVASARGRTTIGNTECPLDVFVDGVRAEGSEADANAVPPEAIHGLEVYTVANAPAKYRVGPCGALFIWTK